MLRWFPTFVVTLLLVGCSSGGGEGAAADPDVPESPPAELEPIVSARCTSVNDAAGELLEVSCTHRTVLIDRSKNKQRRVIHANPSGEPPGNGWPVVFLFQGSGFPIRDFSYTRSDEQGGIHEGQLVRMLVEAGYAVLAPAAPADAFWQTNLPGLRNRYRLSTDFTFLGNVLDAIAAGSFGPLDAGSLFATGISSGGYQTSRMAEAFPGRFRALAIHSASWATCAGPLCELPETLPPEHPPTLFIHGLLDEVVPWMTMDAYHDRLLMNSVPTRRVLDPEGGHAWFPASPQQVLDWFGQWR